MNYVPLEKAYPNTFISTAFEPEYNIKNNATEPSYEDIINQKINVNNEFYCDEMANHIKSCPYCKEKLKKIITEQIKDNSYESNNGMMNNGYMNQHMTNNGYMNQHMANNYDANQIMRTRRSGERPMMNLMSVRNSILQYVPILLLFTIFLLIFVLIMNTFFNISLKSVATVVTS